jgi:hypothetical protein
MSRDLERSTALLAAVFGASLLTATAGAAQSTSALDAQRAREIAVLSRVLERRLGDVRRSMANVAEVKIPTTSADGEC